MTPEAEERVRAALDTLGAAIIEAIHEGEHAHDAAPERLLGIPEVCRQLGVGRSFLYGEISTGRLRSVKVGRRRLVPASELGRLAGGTR